MSHNLLRLLSTRLQSGFTRTSIKTCSQWAEAYRVMGKPFPGKWSFKHHPWTREMHDATEELIVGQKAAQMGFTEVALNRTFYAMDALGESVLYVLPAESPDAKDFSASRFDPALELSPHLAALFTDTKNIGHKRAGSANLFIRGSRSRSQLKSVPTGRIFLDELDEMVQKNIPLVFERTSGQQTKSVYMISTATIDNYGVNEYFTKSTQDHFFFLCPSCGKLIELTFPHCLVITSDDWTDERVLKSHIICPACKNLLPHEGKSTFLQTGRWVPTYPGRTVRGFHINQLYSSTVDPSNLAISYLKGLLNPADEQEFYNSKLGLTHAVEGAKITDAHLATCMGGHRQQNARVRNDTIITMGVDVGKWLHVTINEWYLGGQGNDLNLLATARLLRETKLLHFEELDGLMHDYRVNFCVIDANPERRKALEFAQRFYGRVRLCFYATGISSKNITVHADEEHTISVDRTSWLDLTLGRFRTQRIGLPIDTSLEYKKQLKALVRIYEKDSSGNPVGKYVCGNEDDHFAHAQNYAEIALPLAATQFGAQDIKVKML